MNILQTRHGLIMVRQSPDMISRILAQTGEYEWQVVALCAALAAGHDKGYIVDIGANMGTVTVPLAKKFPGYRVRSYEPQRSVFYQLAGNVALNDLDNVELRNQGLGSSRGTIYIDMPKYKTDGNIGAWSMDKEVREKSPEGRGGGQTEPVFIETLNDTYFDDPIRLIKIDVEGMELEVLRGGCNLLAHHEYPPIVYECWQQFDWYKPRAKELDDYVRGMGYQTHTLGNTIFAVHEDSAIDVAFEGDNLRIGRK
jgi:FkbM family methyltransferase